MGLKSAMVYGAIVVATVVGAEGLARVYDWSPRSRDLAADDGLGQRRYYHSPAGYGDLVPLQDGHWVIWFHRPYHVQTNRVGMRNVEEPSTTAYRVLAIGDSQTFGPYLANEDAWPAWTEYFLRQRTRDAKSVQVFNAGVSGYTILDELNYMREKGVDFKPALVVLGVFENDLYDLRKERNGTVQRPVGGAMSEWTTTLKALARSWALVALAETAKARWQLTAAGVDTRRADVGVEAGARPPDHDALVARYSALFLDLAKLLESNAIKLAVIFIPGVTAIEDPAKSEMEPVIRRLTQESGVPYLDLTPAMRAVGDASERLFLLQRDVSGTGWTGNGHSSREGNAVIGRALSDWLIANALVPGSARRGSSE